MLERRTSKAKWYLLSYLAKVYNGSLWINRRQIWLNDRTLLLISSIFLDWFHYNILLSSTSVIQPPDTHYAVDLWLYLNESFEKWCDWDFFSYPSAQNYIKCICYYVSAKKRNIIILWKKRQTVQSDSSRLYL